ncbi:hybrid sensor histidine kinase/response regulator [Oligoflexus tunisiensis]|uniref:hybrid sensor histidine kinase/response regulator n=1 Tax=Oligoflexus tunisiensis TaxID=708132 RepID=UPI00114D221F|nr:hybrid sensor histidine kinase/response regulator [Oligoflexus tunisiensis]
MQVWWQPRRLQFFLTAHLFGVGLIILLFVSWLSMRQSAHFLRSMTEEAAQKSLSVAQLAVHGWTQGELSGPELDAKRQEQLKKIAAGQWATILVMKTDGTLVAHSPFANDRLYAREGRDRNVFLHQDCYLRCTLQALQDRFGSLKSLDGVHALQIHDAAGPLVAAMARVQDLIVVTIASEKNYEKLLQDSATSLVQALLVLLLVVLAFNFLVGSQVTRPILQLNDAAGHLERGDFHPLQNSQREDEIGQLARSMGSMARRLKDSVRDLESQVERRTADLKDIIEKYAETNKALERNNATKDRIFSIIAHDLKSPFNALKGYSGIISDSLDSLRPDQLREMVDKISVSSEEAHGLLENLLQWALVQTGGMRVKWENHNLREIVLEVFDLMRVNAKVKGIHLDLQLSPDIWVHADRMMVATVIRNLVANAIKFTRSDEGYILCRATEDRDRILMMIEDNGVGIAPAHIGKLFQRSSWFSEKGTRDERGTGLGLGLCREFISLSQGKLEVESQLGKGTRFFVSWKKGQAPAAALDDSIERPLSILYVDDSEDNHDLVRIYLKAFPWKLAFAEDGQKGLEAYKNGHFDIVLMDLNMPVMGGIEATRLLRELEHKEQRPRTVVIAFTSSVLQTDIDAAIQAGCDSYLVKPIKKQNLVNIISRLMKHVRQRSPG